VTELDGTVTTWKPAASGNLDEWVPESVADPAKLGKTSYVTDGNGRVTRIIAPIPEGSNLNCSAVTVTGCRVLAIYYTPAGPGGSSVVSAIDYEAFDPAIGTSSANRVATYSYDPNGYLTSVSDAAGLTTQYTYVGIGNFTVLRSMKQPGLAKTWYEYAWSNQSANDLRLRNISRDTPTEGSTDGPTSIASFVYIEDLNSPSVTGLPDVSAAAVAQWGQTSVPTYGAAVFGADHPTTASGPENYAASDWQDATFSFTNARGYTVNTAAYGAGAWQLTAADYDDKGNVVRSFDNRGTADARADNLAAGTTIDASKRATLFRYNAPLTVGPDGSKVDIPAGKFVTDTWGPVVEAIVTGTKQLVRAHTHLDYDKDAPNGGKNNATGTRYGLVTKTTIGSALATSGSSDINVPIPADIETLSITTIGYDPINLPINEVNKISDTSGWTLGAPTVQTVVMPGTDDIVRQTRYDRTGGIVEVRAPLSDGTDEATTLKTYYTTGTSADPRCSSNVKWAGMLCTTSTAGAQTNEDLPDTFVSGYSKLLLPTTTVESSGSGAALVTRTTVNTYLIDGRSSTNHTDLVGDTASANSSKKQTNYDAASGIAIGVTSYTVSGGTQTLEGTVASTIDKWGRTTSYTNSIDTTPSQTTYVPSGQVGAGHVQTVTDAQGSVTYSYSATDAESNPERRGLPTEMTVSGLGTYKAAYDAQGALKVQTAPGGLKELYRYDGAGKLIQQTLKGTTSTTANTWYWWSRDYDVLGRVINERRFQGADGSVTDAPALTFTYDRAGRLVSAIDRSGAHCTTRSYAFSKNGNRESLSTQIAASGQTCGQGNSKLQQWAYDRSDRIRTSTNDTAHITDAAYAYDLFGRTKTIPGVDTPGSGPEVSISYFDTDLIRSIEQNGSTTTFTLDPADRRLLQTSGSTVATRHYTDGSDNPSWISETVSGTSSPTIDRYTPSFGSSLTGQIRSVAGAASKTILVADPHGDVVAAIPIPASGDATAVPAGWSSYDEYGASAVPSTTGAGNYGWLGSAERSTSSSGLILMGVRGYNPITGRFLSLDPVEGGNENAYTYPNDPVNASDTSGEAWWNDVWKNVQGVAKVITDNPVTSMILEVCGLVPGLVGSACSVVQSAAYLIQGDYKNAAISAVSAVVGGVAGKAIKAASRAITASKVVTAARLKTGRARAIATGVRRLTKPVAWAGEQLASDTTSKALKGKKRKSGK